MGPLPPTWKCSFCTTDHEGEEARFLQCKTCGNPHTMVLTDDDSDEQPRRSERNKKNKLADGADGPAAAPGASWQPPSQPGTQSKILPKVAVSSGSTS